MAIENFGVGTLIIPMDATYQNLGMYRAYGLVYELLDNGIPVKWVIQSGKAFNGTDFIASAQDFQTLAPIINHPYSGGPFIIDSAFAAAAAPIITAWQAVNPNVKVHVATAPFSADIAATMNRPPRIAVEASNASIAYGYLNAAGIPDANGNTWSNASPGVLSEAEIAAGALFGFDLTECRRNAYDILISPHTGAGQWDDPNLIIELNDWLYQGGFLHSMCESIPSIENEAGPFLTQTGLDDSDKNGGDNGTFTVVEPDFPTTQAVNTTNPQPLPGGSVETWLNANQNYNPQTQVLAYFVEKPGTQDEAQYDFMIAGPYKNGNGAGKVVYEGGHQYTTSLPYTNGPENMYTRFVLNDVFFAVGKPLMYLDFTTPNPNNVLYQGQNNTITFSVVNTGASPATNTGFSVTLAPGVTYNGDASIPPTSIVGQTLTWSPAALGNVPPGTVLTFTADYTPMGPLGDTQLATFSTSFGDEFNENYSMNDICIEGEVAAFESADLDVTKDVDLDFATYGDTLTYTVSITNNGVLTATNVLFKDIIPDNATFVPNSVTIAVPPGLPVPQPGADPNIGFALPDIPPFPAPGSTVVVTFQATVDTMAEPDNIVNKAEVDYQFTLDGTTFDATSESNVVVTQVNVGELTLVKTTDTTVATIGDVITYTVLVFNTGNVDAENVVFFDNPPAGTNFIPGSVFVNGVNQPGANPIVGIPLGTIIPGTIDSPSFVTVSFQVEVTSIPVPPTAINSGSADFEWRVDPQGPTTPGMGISNEVITQLVEAEITVVKSSDVAFANLGDTITYTSIVTNTGDVTANNVVFTDAPPAGTTFVPGSVTVDGNPNPGNPSLGIPLGNMAPGASITVTFQVTATSAPVPNPTINTSNASGSFVIDPQDPPVQLDFDSNEVEVQIENAFITPVKSVDLAFAEVGDTLTYTVVINNPGTTDANNVVFTDNPPNGTSFVPGSVTVNGLPVPGDPSLGIPVGTILEGGFATVTFDVTVDNIPVPNPTINFGTVDADLPVDPNNSIHVTVDTNLVPTQVEIAQVDLLKSVDQAFAEVGDILTYTVTMTNVGTVPANNPVFTDIVPNGTTFVPNSVLVNGIPTPGDPSIGIPLANIPPGGIVTVSFQAEVTSTPVPNPAVNIGTLSAEYPVDPNNPIQKDFDSNPLETQVETAQVDVVKTVDKAFAEVGDTLTYTTTITNTGTVPATSVIFTDVPSTGTSFIPGTLTVNGFPTAGNPAVGIPLADIPVAGVTVVSFQVSVDAIPVPNPAENISVVDALYPVDPNNPEPKTFESNPALTLVVIAALDVVKSADPNFAEVGDTITFTSVITNTGTLPATNVVFNDIVPNGLTFVPGSVTINGLPSGGNPNFGIPLPNIPVAGVVTVAFDVTVTSIPVPNPITNLSTVDARFLIDPNQPPVLRNFVSNPEEVKVEVATVDVVKSADKAFVEIGDIVTYTVVMTNTGTVPANNAELTDIVPNGTTFVPGSVTINGFPSGSNPATGIPVGTIPVAGFATVTFQVQVTSLPVPNPTNNIANLEAAFPVDPTGAPVIKDFDSNIVQFQVEIAEVTAVKTADKQFVEVGDTVTYTVVVTNTGTVTAQNVNFVDTIPPETTFVPNSVQVNGVPQPGANPQTGINLGDILPGGARTVTFVVTVDSLPADQTITNTGLIEFDVRIDPDGPLLPRETPTNPVDTQVEIADINVVKTADKEFVEVGDTLTYTVVVNNTGTVTVDNVIFNDAPPVGTTFVPGTFRINGVLQPGADPNVGVNLGSIPPGGLKTVSFRVTVDVLPPGGQITNTASVDFDFRIDPNGPVETRTEPSNPLVTEVELVQMQVIKDVDKTVAVVGDTLTYTVNIANAGTVTAQDVVFTDEIPNGTSLVEDSVIVNGVTQPGANPETGIPIGDIPPGGFATVVFSVLVEERPEPPEVVNVPVIDFNVQIDPEGPISPRTEEGEPVVTRIEVVELTAVKTADKSVVKVGDTLCYTVAITNTGTVPVENVVFKDDIPEGTKLVANSVTVNGVVQPGANPITGVLVGTIQPRATVLVKFCVTIESMPCPPELINMAVIDFEYRLESTGPVLTDSTTSNEVLTDVGLRIFKQLSIDENLTIPEQKPDAETLLDVMAEVEITATTIIKTPVVTSYEGQKLTGWKIIVEGKLIQKIVYIADNQRQSVHAAHYEVPFSTYLVLPEDFNHCQKIRVVGYIEDIFSKLVDPRTVFKNVTLRLEGILNCIPNNHH